MKPSNVKNPTVGIDFARLHPELTAVILEAMRRMFDPVYNMRTMLRENAELRHRVIEMFVAIELISISQGRRDKPSEGMIHCMQKLIRNEGGDESLVRERFADLVTLLYLDKKSKIIRALIKHPSYPDLFAAEVINIVSLVTTKEGRDKLKRQNSDLTKVEGGSKNVKMEAYFKDIEEEDGNIWCQEATATEPDEFLKRVTRSNDWPYYEFEIVSYAEKLYRSDRAQNILRVVRYYFKEPSNQVSLTQMAKDLGISYKTVFAIVKTIRNDVGLRKIIKSLL